jgi:hypothetical protein
MISTERCVVTPRNDGGSPELSGGAVSGCVADESQTASPADAPQQAEHRSFGFGRSVFAAAMTSSGTETEFACAQATFSEFVKQQHCFQHWSAEPQPQGRSWQGNGRDLSLPSCFGRDAGPGIKANTTPVATAKTISRPAPERQVFFRRKVIFFGIGSRRKVASGPFSTSPSLLGVACE